MGRLAVKTCLAPLKHLCRGTFLAGIIILQLNCSGSTSAGLGTMDLAGTFGEGTRAARRLAAPPAGCTGHRTHRTEIIAVQVVRSSRHCCKPHQHQL